MAQRPTLQSYGFTLIELMLVLVVICIALATAAPSLGRWGRGARLKDSANQILALTRWARTQAVADAQLCRFHVDPRQGTYWVDVQDADQFTTPGTDFGQVFSVPTGAKIQLADLQGKPLDVIVFEPTGRTQPARIQIGDDDATLTMECPSATEGFRLINQVQPQ